MCMYVVVVLEVMWYLVDWR